MRSLTLLLIPLILLSSCTIDWNDEKDKKIVELNNGIRSLTKEYNDSLNEQIRLQKAYKELANISTLQTYSGNLLEIRNAECQAELKQLKNK